MEANKIKLLTQEGSIVEESLKVMMRSLYIKGMIDDNKNTEEEFAIP